MFSCRNCSRAFESRSRYKSHLEICDDDGDRRSVTSSIAPSDASRSMSRRSKDMSLKSAVEKLMDERIKLKGDIKKLTASREELDTSQAYYQGQVTSLLDERDELSEQVERYKDEAQRARSEATNKVAIEKRKHETKIDAKANEIIRLNAKVESMLGQIQTNELEKQQQREALELSYRRQLEQVLERARSASQGTDAERADAHRRMVEQDMKVSLAETNRGRAEEAHMKTKQELGAQITTLTNENALLKAHNRIAGESVKTDCDRMVAGLRASHDAAMKQLQDELLGVRNELAINKSDKRVREQEDDIAHLNHIVKQRESVIEKVRVESDSLKKQFVSNLNKQQMDTEAAITDRDRMIHDLEGELRSTRAEAILKIREATSNNNATVREIADLKAQLHVKENEIKTVVANTAKANAHREAALKSEITERVAAARNAAEREAERIYNEKLVVIQGQLNAAKLTTSEHTHQLAIVRREAATRINEVAQKNKEDIRNLETDAKSKTDAAVASAREEATAEAKVQNDKKIEAVCREALARLNDEVSKHEKEIAGLKHHIADKNREIDSVVAQSKGIERNSAAQAAQLIASAKDESTKAMNSIVSERDGLMRQVADLRNQITNVKADAMTKLNNQITDHDTRIAVLKRDHSDVLTAKVAEIVTLTKNADAKNANLVNALNEASSEAKKAKTDLIEAEAKLKDRAGEIVKLTAHLKELGTGATLEVTKLTEDLKSKDAALTLAKEQIKTMSEELTVARDTPNLGDKLRKVRDDCLKTLKKERAEVDRLETLTDELKIKNFDLEAKLSQKSGEVDTNAQAQQQIRMSFIDSLNNQKEMYEKAISEKDSIIDKRDARLSELETLMTGAMQKIVDK